MQLVGILIIGTQLSFYFMTVLSNPGFPKRSLQDKNANLEKGNNLQQCKKCKFYYEIGDGTTHCYECQVCITGIFCFYFFLFSFLGYDHHCPWTTKCIGKNNLCYFYVFIISTSFMFCYLILSISLIDNN